MTNYLASLRGTISTPYLKEIFVHTFAIISSASQSTVANNLATQWQACLNTGVASFPLKSMFPGQVAYNECTVAELLNAEPPEPRLAAATHVLWTDIQGTGTLGMIPSQCAVAVSVKAGTRPNGLPQKGRWYLPSPDRNQLDQASGLLSTGTEVKIRDTVADFWAKMNQAGDRPALWSRKYGTVKAWDQLRVGRTVDTIRRRRNELPEIYSQYVTVA